MSRTPSWSIRVLGMLLLTLIAAGPALATISPATFGEITRTGCTLNVPVNVTTYDTYKVEIFHEAASIATEIFTVSSSTTLHFDLNPPYDPRELDLVLSYSYNGGWTTSDKTSFTQLPNACPDEDDIPPGPGPQFRPTDRINQQPYATFTVQCDLENNRIVIYAIELENDGTAQATGLPIVYSLANLPETPPAVPEVLASNGLVTLYLLPNGEFKVIGQVVEGKAYAFIFDGCPPSSMVAGTQIGAEFIPSEIIVVG